VTLGAGNASHVSDNVPFCPRSTFMSDSDCVILSGARKEEKYLGDCLNRTTYMLRKQELFVEISVLNIS